MRCYLSVASWLLLRCPTCFSVGFSDILSAFFPLCKVLVAQRPSFFLPLFKARLPDPWIPVVSESPGSTSSRFQLMTLAARLTRPEKPAYPLVEPGSEPGREKCRCRCPNVVNSVGH